MAQVEEDIIAEGAFIVWVLQEDTGVQPGTAERCRNFMNFLGSDQGWCVGDSETMPSAFTFKNSPFARGRGTDILVRRSDMQILFAANHGTPSGNDNLTGADVLRIVRENK